MADSGYAALHHHRTSFQSSLVWQLIFKDVLLLHESHFLDSRPIAAHVAKHGKECLFITACSHGAIAPAYRNSQTRNLLEAKRSMEDRYGVDISYGALGESFWEVEAAVKEGAQSTGKSFYFDDEASGASLGGAYLDILLSIVNSPGRLAADPLLESDSPPFLGRSMAEERKWERIKHYGRIAEEAALYRDGRPFLMRSRLNAAIALELGHTETPGARLQESDLLAIARSAGTSQEDLDTLDFFCRISVQSQLDALALRTGSRASKVGWDAAYFLRKNREVGAKQMGLVAESGAFHEFTIKLPNLQTLINCSGREQFQKFRKASERVREVIKYLDEPPFELRAAKEVEKALKSFSKEIISQAGKVGYEHGVRIGPFDSNRALRAVRIMAPPLAAAATQLSAELSPYAVATGLGVAAFQVGASALKDWYLSRPESLEVSLPVKLDE